MKRAGVESQPPWRSHRLVYTVYADSLESTTFHIIESSEDEQIDGVYLAVILINILESPLYEYKDFKFPMTKFNRIEIGRHVQLRRGFNFTEDANNASVDFKKLQSDPFLRTTILNSIESGELTPAMEHTIRNNPTLDGKVYNYPRVFIAMIANAMWLLGWIALLVEIIFAHLRRKKNRHRYFNDLCYRCDYQLTRDMHQCPECGTQINWRSYLPEKRT